MLSNLPMRLIGSFWLLTGIIPITANAQEPGFGGNPPSMNWQQFDTEAGKFIFPKGYDSLAFRAAALLQLQRNNDQSILAGRPTKKQPIILQPLSTLPAGFSTPAPWRSELFLMPPQNAFMGAVPWFDMLTVHEYRHSQQFWAANQGFTRLYQVLLGETGWLLSALVTQPLWFREGDATAIETALTQAGRGRQPAFHMETRAMLLSGIRYSYDKGTWFSYKDFVPNPYRGGYYMVSQARAEYGDSIWTAIVREAHRKKGLFYGFTRSMKMHLGMNAPNYYKYTMNVLDSVWRENEGGATLTRSQTVVSAPEKYTDYRWPHFLDDSTLVVWKESRDIAPTFCRVSLTGNEQPLFEQGIYTSDHWDMNYANDLLTWCESAFHPRWENVNYSVIETYNVRTGKREQITKRSRFFAPEASHDGQRIVAVEVDAGMNCSLVILTGDGQELQRMGAAGPTFLRHPTWTEHDRGILVVEHTDRGNALVEYDLASGLRTVLVDFRSELMERPVVWGDHVFFSAGFGDVNNIYCLDRSVGEMYQVTATRFGAFDPAVSPDGQRLAFSEYTAMGHTIKVMSLDNDQWQLVTDPGAVALQMTEIVTEQENINVKDVTVTQYEARSYRSFWKGWARNYGWFPIPNVPEYGLEFYTRDLMSTKQSTLGVLYNTRENALRGYARMTLAMLYPHINVTGEYGLRRTPMLEGTDANMAIVVDTQWTEHSLGGSLLLPLNLTQGTHRGAIDLSVGGRMLQANFRDSVGEETGTLNTPVWEVGVSLSRLKQRARQHVRPRWGQSLSAHYQVATRALPAEATSLTLAGALFFPGVSRTHSLAMSGLLRTEALTSNYRFPDVVQPARGYKSQTFSLLMVGRVNYQLPVWYPDVALGGIAFIQRVRLNGFFDYGQGELGSQVTTMRSIGAEVLIDLKLLRVFQIALGPQVAFAIDAESQFFFNFVVPQFEFSN